MRYLPSWGSSVAPAARVAILPPKRLVRDSHFPAFVPSLRFAWSDDAITCSDIFSGFPMLRITLKYPGLVHSSTGLPATTCVCMPASLLYSPMLTVDFCLQSHSSFRNSCPAPRALVFHLCVLHPEGFPGPLSLAEADPTPCSQLPKPCRATPCLLVGSLLDVSLAAWISA